MDVCLRVLKESNKSRFDSYSVRNSVLIISHITFRDCRVHSFSDNLSRNSCIWARMCRFKLYFKINLTTQRVWLMNFAYLIYSCDLILYLLQRWCTWLDSLAINSNCLPLYISNRSQDRFSICKFCKEKLWKESFYIKVLFNLASLRLICPLMIRLVFFTSSNAQFVTVRYR